MKGEGKNCELAECAMRGRVSAEAHLHTRENGEWNTTEGGEWEESRRVARKRREERRKRRRVSQKSPQVFIFKTFHIEKTKLFIAKTADIQNKKFTFALDKTQLSLFPAAQRRPHSAKSRGNPDESAQMLFDLLKKSRYSAVGGCIGKKIGRNIATIRSGRNARRGRRFRAVCRPRRHGGCGRRRSGVR